MCSVFCILHCCRAKVTAQHACCLTSVIFALGSPGVTYVICRVLACLSLCRHSADASGCGDALPQCRIHPRLPGAKQTSKFLCGMTKVLSSLQLPSTYQICKSPFKQSSQTKFPSMICGLHVSSVQAPQRTVEFVTERWVYVKAGLPICTKGPVEASPYNPLPVDAAGGQAVMGIKIMGRRMETPDILTLEFQVPRGHGE